MAKKAKAGHRSGKRQAAKTKARGKAKAAAAKGKRRQPVAVPLPGMEDVRVRQLDNVCVRIAETREAINALRGEENDHEIDALTLMKKHDRTTYRHAGVELVLVPGEMKLRVRTTRERTATAETEAEAGDETDASPLSETETDPNSDK